MWLNLSTFILKIYLSLKNKQIIYKNKLQGQWAH